MNPQNYTINIRPGWGISQVVKVSQGDVGRPLAFTIMDGQDAITLSSTATVTITGTKPSGLGFTQACTLSGNTASIDTVATMTQEAGSVPAELIVTDGSTVIGTANFVMYVEPAAHPEGTTDGDAETARDLMTRATAAVEQAEAAAEQAEASAEAISQAGIDTTGSTAGQVPTSNGNGSWSWQTPQAGGGGTSDDIENASSVTGSTVSDALDTLSDDLANEETTRSEADASLRTAIDNLVSPTGQSVVVDSSLSISGAAADAQVTGDRLAEMKDGIADASLIDDGAIGAEKLSADVASALNPVKLDTLYLYGDEAEIQTNWENRDKSKMNFRYVFVHADDNEQKNGWCKLKLQGQTSIVKPKHNFNIQFFKDANYTNKDKTNYYDFGKHPKFTIKANYIDYSQARNIVSARLWGDIVHSRPDMRAELSDAPNHGAVDGHPIILYLNDRYYGLYTFNMPKEDWMLGLDEDDPLTIAVGAENGGDANLFKVVGTSNWTVEVPDAWTSYTDETTGVTTSSQTNFLSMMDFVVNSTDANFVANIGEYFNLPSLIDYYIYTYFVCNADTFNKNQLMCSWDCGKTWYFTAYDMDETFGINLTGTVSYTFECLWPDNRLFKRLESLFAQEIYERYLTLRDSVLADEYIYREFELFFNLFPDGEREKDKLLWTGVGNKNASTLEYFAEFIHNRGAWCDAKFERMNPDFVACTGIALDQASLSFDDVGATQTLTATVTPADTTESIRWTSSNEEIATVVNGVVTSMADGKCVITATCGEYSATCAVTVDLVTLPEGYTMLQHVTVPSNAYFDSGVIPDENFGFAVKYDASVGSRTTGMSICGNNTGTSGGYTFNTINHENVTTWYSAGAGTPICQKNDYANALHTIELREGVHVYIDNTYVKDINKGSNNPYPNNTLLTFANRYNLNNGGMRKAIWDNAHLYWLKYYDGTTLIKHYVPCIRNSDSRVGLYDVVNDAFILSAGTAFTQ